MSKNRDNTTSSKRGDMHPQSSTSLPVVPTRNSPVLPTPSSSTTVRHLTAPSVTSNLVLAQQQLAELERQLQDANSGIEKNVLSRQIRQLQDKIRGQHRPSASSSTMPTTSISSVTAAPTLQQQPVSTSSTSSVTSSASEQEQLTPETMEKLRLLERDLNSYRSSLVPGTSRKEKLLNQRANALNPLPSPSTSSMQETSASLSSSLLPLPPPLTGTTPTKRRSKVPNNDRRNNDIEFATEIGQGLLVEVRKMQTMLQEKEEQLRALQIQKADLERAAEALTKQLRQKEEAEERLKEEAWNLELIKQELTISVTKLQQQLSKANVDQHKLDRQLMTVTGELEQVRSREDKLTVAMETLKTRHEQDMAGVRRHLASMQREKQELNKQMDVLSSELAIAKAQSRMARRSHQDLGADAYHPESFEGGLLAGATLAAGMDAHHSDDSPDSSPHDKPNALLSPSSSSTSSATNRQQQQAMEVESLRTSLGHAHRMISTLRSNLHKEKTEKFELKKLLADSQETIEQFQNDPRMWEDADPTNDQEPSSSADALATGTLAGATRRGGGRRARRRSRLRSLGQHASSSTNLAGSRPVSQVLEVDNEFEDDDNVSTDDDQDEYSSAETDFEEDLPVRNSWRDKQQKPKLPMPLPLSLELSQSQSRSGSTSPVRMTPSLSTDPTHPASPSSSTERSPRPHRSLGDELTLADPVSQLPADPETEPASHHALPDALMGAAVGAVGATLANTLANKAQPPSPGVNVSCQTDDVVPVETKHVEAQTDDVVVSLPVESKHVEAQTDDVVVSLPVESKHVEAQTDDVVVTLPVETKHVEAQTDDVVVSLPVESRHVEAQTDEVVVSLPVETKHVEAQTDDVVVSLPVESKHVEAQTDDVVVTLPVETKHVEAQTDDVVVSVPVVSIQGGVQTDKVFVVDPSSLCESAVQTAVVPLLDTAAQCEPISSHDDLLQTEALAVKDQSTQSTPAPVLHQAVQSDPLAGYDMSVQATIAAEAPLAPVQAAIDGQGAAPVDAALHLVQPEPEMAAVPNAKPTVESVKPTTSSNEPQAQRETEMATVASGKAAGPSEPTASASSQNNSSTLSSLLTTGAAALGLGALMGMKSKDAMDSHVGTSDKAPSTSANDLPSPDNPQVPLPSESAAQLDNREASGDMPVTKMMPSQALPSTPPASPMPTTEDVSEDTKRHTCDMSTAPHDMESFGLSPTSGRPSLESQPNSLNTSVDSFPSSKANDTSSSPSSPSTPVHSHDNSPMATATLGSAALARHSLMSVPQASPAPPNTRLDKGKEAMQASPPSHYGMAYAPQNHHNAMARVNPNYYNQAKHASTISQATANGHPDEFDSTLLHAPRSTSPAPSASSAMDPSIALITETMMGHWLWKSPRRSHTLRRQDPLHQRYFWIHPYTRTLYWSREAPGAPRRDSKTKSAYIETIQVVPNQLHAAGINVPDVSICVMTSDGEMKLTAPDMATHKTWVESLSYILARKPDQVARSLKPSVRTSRPSSQHSSSYLNLGQHSHKQRPSILNGFFGNSSSNALANKDNSSTSTGARMADLQTDDEEFDKLEDLRMCCDGKHHLSHLERERIHPKRPKYPAKRSLRPHSVAFV